MSDDADADADADLGRVEIDQADVDAVDFVVAAYLDDDVWTLARLPERAGASLDLLLEHIDPRDGVDALALVSVDEDFFAVVRVASTRVRLLLSDVTAMDDWPLASDIADELDLPDPEDDDDPQLGGDPGLAADLGLSAVDVAVICDDDMYPDEALREIADRLGFVEQLDELLDAVDA